MTEFDMAYHHNVAVKRKKRLIVLMMLDSPNYDIQAESLRQYVRQYTYIDYTAGDWFDKLLYALPLGGLLQRGDDADEQLPAATDDDVPLLRQFWDTNSRSVN